MQHGFLIYFDKKKKPMECLKWKENPPQKELSLCSHQSFVQIKWDRHALQPAVQRLLIVQSVAVSCLEAFPYDNLLGLLNLCAKVTASCSEIIVVAHISLL